MNPYLNSLYHNLYGSGSATQAYQNLTPAQQQSVGQAVNTVQHNYNQMLSRVLLPVRAFRIAGQDMDLQEFVDTLCPDPDDPMRSLLLIRYSGLAQ